MNATVEAIKRRFPGKILLSSGDIASACGFSTSAAILSAIKLGKIDAVRFGKRFVIGREEAIRFLEEAAYNPEEGEIPK